MYTHLYTHGYTHVHTYTYWCIYTCICTYTCTYTYIHIYTCTHNIYTVNCNFFKRSIYSIFIFLILSVLFVGLSIMYVSCIYMYIYIYAPPWGLSTLVKEFSDVARIMQSSSNELNTLVSGKVKNVNKWTLLLLLHNTL